MSGVSFHSSRRIGIAVHLLLLGLPGLAAAQQARYSSAHFTLTAPAGYDMTRLMDELERAYDDVRRKGLSLPGMIHGTSYASTSGFVRGSGGRAFHLALARDERLHLQPLPVLLKNGDLPRALRHELTHVALADAARRGLPRWFNEGMALAVAGERHSEGLAFTSLRQLDDTIARSASHEHLRDAYGTAGRLTRNLLERHGMSGMLALVRTVARRGDFERAFRGATGTGLREWERSELGGR